MRYDRHELSAEYPDITGQTWADYVANVADFGIIEGRKITLHEGKVIDGWQLYRACLEAKVEPKFKELQLPPGMSVERWVATTNDYRRHETQALMADRAAKRRDRVAAARVEGKSTRTIAKEEGVSQTTIQSDIAALTEQGVQTAPVGGHVVSADGVSRPATKADKTLCTACQTKKRKGQDLPSACSDCKSMTAPKGTKPEPQQPDDYLPKSVRNALADTWHADCARTLSAFRAQCKGAFSWSSWLDADVLKHLKAAEDCFLAAIPRRVCPGCNGQKVVENQACMTCRSGGYLASQV